MYTGPRFGGTLDLGGPTPHPICFVDTRNPITHTAGTRTERRCQVAELRTPDGRTLEWYSDGPDDGPLVVYCHGTPSHSRSEGALADALLTRGARLVGISRPGYRGSTRMPGRSVADVANDVQALLNELGRTEFRTVGWSGGGPHALALGVLVPGCEKVVTLAGVAPFDSMGESWTVGMGDENVTEFGLSVRGEAALRAMLDPMAEMFAELSGEVILAGGMGDLLCEEDLRVVRLPGEADTMARALRLALEMGNDGYVDDDLAFVKPWGFSLAAMKVPVELWQGDADRMVPHTHAVALSEAIPGATLHLLPNDGHISIGTTHAAAIAQSILN